MKRDHHVWFNLSILGWSGARTSWLLCVDMDIDGLCVWKGSDNRVPARGEGFEELSDHQHEMEDRGGILRCRGHRRRRISRRRNPNVDVWHSMDRPTKDRNIYQVYGV